MRILVTGGAGFIGSHACKALAAAGHEPITFDNLSTGHSDAVKWGPLVVGDLRDPDAVDRAFKAHSPDAVIHFAALAYVGDSVREPLRYYNGNVSGSVSLLEAMHRHNVSRIIFSSTCATYGVPDKLPITEETPQRPINPYGRTKLAIEWLLADCAAAYGLQWVALRYFNAAGADADGELGERHDPETHALPLAILAALDGKRCFDVFGEDYDTLDGSAVRDYIHVSDLADAHVKALDHLVRGGANGAFNLATGQGVSVKQLVDAVERATGRRANVRYAPRRAGDPPALFASAAKARDVLGWVPAFSDFDRTVATAVRWFERQHNRREN